MSARPVKVLAVIASPPAGNPYGLALHVTLDNLPGAQVTYLETGTQAPPTLAQLRQALAGAITSSTSCATARSRRGARCSTWKMNLARWNR
ncbi:MAG: hypothetical protein EXR62_18465 [Chloroflexi bacterium]|nr:hypothetical protein [Chloroflexota bacterium]